MVADHSLIESMEQDMEEIAISKFKATCLAVLERVRQTGRPIRVTRFGVPVAEVVPPSAPKRPSGWLGCMRGRVEIKGDIIAPAVDPGDWEVVRD